MTRGQPRLIAAFRRAERRLLRTALAPGSLIVESLSPSGATFAAVDLDGSWALVVAARRSGKPVPVLKLSSLSADYGVNYELHGSVGVETLRVCVVRCGSADPAIRALFGTFCVALLEELSDDPSDSEIECEVSKWVALFWHLQAPPRTTVIGLIGELTLLDSVEDVTEWVRAWHSDTRDNLDFAFSKPPLSVEVKATSSQERVHELSVYQVLPPSHQQHFFASVIVELREAGTRLGDVVDEIAGQLATTTEAQMFWRTLASVCGASLSEFFGVRYMRNVAQDTLHFYSAESVPQPGVEFPLPAGVSGLRFRSDFSSVEPTSFATILALAARR